MKPSEEINQLKARREAGKQDEHGFKSLLVSGSMVWYISREGRSPCGPIFSPAYSN